MTGVSDAQATFTGIANAIRSKTGKSATMKITDMAAEINSIETDTRVTLTVTVNNSSGALSGATVVASFSGGSDLTSITNSSGIATFSVKPGYDYSIVVSKTGYITTSASTVHVDAAGASKTITIGAKPVVTVNQTGGTGAVTVSGGTYTVSGNKYTLDSPGTTYTFSVAQVSLHVKPADQTVNLAANGTQTLSFTHTAYPTVTVSQTGATGTVSCSPTAAAQSGNVFTLVPGTSYTFSVSQVSGYFKPANQTVSYSAGTTNNISFTHQAYPTVAVTVSSNDDSVISGRTIRATNGTDTQTGTTNSSGTVTLTLQGTGSYTITCTDSIDGCTVTDATITASAGGSYSATVTLTIAHEHYWGVTIDETVSDCASMVQYAASLSTGAGTYTNTIPTNATPMSGADSLSLGSFASGDCATLIEGIKPVSFNGSTWSDLNKTNESSWPSSQGTDCFTEFPFRWLSITKSGDKITVVFSDAENKPDSTFQDWAFLGADGTTRRPNFHLGCYAAIGTVSSSAISGGIYSYRGGTSAVNMRLNQYWVGARNRNGADNSGEYDCLPYQMWTYLQCLFLVLYKTTNCQAAHSNGISSGTQTNANTGFTYSNNWGMKGTTANKTSEMAFFWLHNLWGNMYQFSASVFTRANGNSDSSIYYQLAAMSHKENWDQGFGETGTSNRATMAGKGTDSGSDGWTSGGYYTKACGNNGAGFLLVSTTGSGSATTYYPDYGNVYVYSSYAFFPSCGGYYSSDDYCGLFYVYVGNTSSTSNSSYGSRLAYRGGHAYA